LIDHYDPVILGAQDYYPFGMLSRVAVPNDDPYYRFGFNGKMNDNDVKGLGNEINYGERISDPRTGGRFFSVDPLSQKYPWLSPYQFAGNNPIKFIDLDGAEPFNPDKYVNSDAPRVDAKYKNVTLHEPPLRLGAAEQGIIGAFNASCKAAGLISEIFWASHVDEKYKNQVQFPLTNNNLGFVAKNIIVAPASLAAELKKDPGNAELWGEAAMMVVPFLKVKPTTVIVSVPESMEAAMKRVPEFPMASSKVTIGLGTDMDLLSHRRTGAITYKNAGWQQAGLTKVDWGKALVDESSFKESFRQAAGKADAIRFDVSNFDRNTNRITEYEFNYITNDPSLLQKTTFIKNGGEVKWDGKQFTKK